MPLSKTLTILNFDCDGFTRPSLPLRKEPFGQLFRRSQETRAVQVLEHCWEFDSGYLFES